MSHDLYIHACRVLYEEKLHIRHRRHERRNLETCISQLSSGCIDISRTESDGKRRRSNRLGVRIFDDLDIRIALLIGKEHHIPAHRPHVLTDRQPDVFFVEHYLFFKLVSLDRYM